MSFPHVGKRERQSHRREMVEDKHTILSDGSTLLVLQNVHDTLIVAAIFAYAMIISIYSIYFCIISPLHYYRSLFASYIHVHDKSESPVIKSNYAFSPLKLVYYPLWIEKQAVCVGLVQSDLAKRILCVRLARIVHLHDDRACIFNKSSVISSY